MLLSWLRRRRRRRLLATPFPPAWLDHLAQHVPHYARLNENQQAKLRDDLRVFIAERHWEACAGLTMSDEIQVAIAAQACQLTLCLDLDLYDRVPTILVFPSNYLRPEKTYIADEIAIEGGEEDMLGEAVYGGPVVMSWEDIREGGRFLEEGENLVLHEFAHQLDMRAGVADGTPPMSSEKLDRWRKVMSAEFARLNRAARRGRPTLLDEYGATDEAEFFSVATECFFERPLELQRHHGELYDLLRDYYRQDPTQWPQFPLPEGEG